MSLYSTNPEYARDDGKEAKKIEGGPFGFSDDFQGPRLDPFWGSSGSIDKSLVFTRDPDFQAPLLEITVLTGDGDEKDHREGAERIEIKERSEQVVPADTNIWYGVSVRIPPDFNITENRLVIIQWRQLFEGDSHPAMALRYIGGKLLLTIQENETRHVFEAPEFPIGKLNRIVINRFVDTKGIGHCTAFVNGVEFATYTGRIGYERYKPEARLRMGAYRDTASYPDTIGFARFRRGASKEFCD